MTAQCTYTGARVYFQEYGYMAPADLYVVADSVIIRWNVEGRQFINSDEDATHIVYIHHGWHRDDIGVTVVPKDQVIGALYR